jgi:hypothetical protein
MHPGRGRAPRLRVCAVRALCLPVLVAGTAGACTNADAPEVRDVAASFAGADPAGRCQLLSAATRTALEKDESAPCPAALAGLPVGSGEVRSVEVWGQDALVHLSDDSLFLTRGPQGWQVSAAACEPDGEGPYVCQVEGS